MGQESSGSSFHSATPALVSDRFKLQAPKMVNGDTRADAQDFDSDNSVFLIKIEDDARLYLLGFYNRSLIQTEVESVGISVNFQFHCFLPRRRSKKTVKIRFGETFGFTTTRNERP